MERGQVTRRIADLRGQIDHLLAGYDKGRCLREGFRVLILGQPNVGKSSLFNLLLEQDRAIVTEIPGTTRDLIEGWLIISGVRVGLVDSAGLRETQEKVEAIGMERAWADVARADLVFWVVEAGSPISLEDHTHIKKLRADGKDVMVLANKADAFPNGSDDRDVILVSARRMDDRGVILKVIENRLAQLGGTEQVVISQARHYEALKKAANDLVEASVELDRGVGPEFVVLSLKEALLQVQGILGVRYDDQIIDTIFKEFCLGK
jgi:tRNA modification GTPase